MGMVDLCTLEIGYGKIALMPPIEVSLPANKVSAIIGLNGAGKSTLLKTIAGLSPSISGQVCIDGKDIQKTDMSELSLKRSIVLTGRNEVVATMKVEELYRLSRTVHHAWMGKLQRADYQRMEEVADTLDLTTFLQRPLYTLSDGEYQRVMIGRALVQETPLVLLDEPTAHLDIIQRKKTFVLLQSLPAQFSVSVVYSTHEIDLALAMADFFVVLEKGSPVRFGSQAEMKSVIQQQFFAD